MWLVVILVAVFPSNSKRLNRFFVTNCFMDETLCLQTTVPFPFVGIHSRIGQNVVDDDVVESFLVSIRHDEVQGPFGSVLSRLREESSDLTLNFVF